MPDLTLVQWSLGLLCAFFVGIAKTGIPGIFMLVVPFMVLVAGDARLAAGWLLPAMCLADVAAILYWRRHAAASRLFHLAPWVLAGMALGAAALSLSERLLRPAIGVIVLVMLGADLWRRWRPDAAAAAGRSAPYGIVAGFATTVANAAGPVMNVYLLRSRLSKEEFLATGAWFFFVINLGKVPIYAWHGLFSSRSLVFDALMAPAVLIGAVTGRWLVDRISQRVFDVLVVILTAASTLLLFR
jgi:hypothetical protein